MSQRNLEFFHSHLQIHHSGRLSIITCVINLKKRKSMIECFIYHVNVDSSPVLLCC